MIQIGENDTLWYFYKKYYTHSQEQLKPPENLCNYFWTAAFGALKTFYWELSLFIVFPCFALLAFGCYKIILYSEFNKDRPSFPQFLLGMSFSVLLFIFILLAFLSIITRWFKYWTTRSELVTSISGCVLAVLGFSFLFSFSFLDKEVGWTLWNLLYGFFIVASFVIFSFGYYLLFSNKTNLSKNIRQYFSAVKNKVCPLVDPPQSFKDKEREKWLNCGDG